MSERKTDLREILNDLLTGYEEEVAWESFRALGRPDFDEAGDFVLIPDDYHRIEPGDTA